MTEEELRILQALRVQLAMATNGLDKGERLAGEMEGEIQKLRSELAAARAALQLPSMPAITDPPEEEETMS
jgi:hypothetical protein